MITDIWVIEYDDPHAYGTHSHLESWDIWVIENDDPQADGTH